MYKYETHCHTSPVSICAHASVEDTVCFYKKIGYDGIFITNHFLDGNFNLEARNLPYTEQIDFYFSGYEEGLKIGESIGISVFPGVELSYKGTDFLIYGLDKQWYKDHPEILQMKKTEELSFMMEEGAFVIQAHPYREADYIDHIRLFPRSVHGVEVVNTSQKPEIIELAEFYADHYGLLKTYGSDNHWGSNVFETLIGKGLEPVIAGMSSELKINCVDDYIEMVKAGQMKPVFSSKNDLEGIS